MQLRLIPVYLPASRTRPWSISLHFSTDPESYSITNARYTYTFERPFKMFSNEYETTETTKLDWQFGNFVTIRSVNLRCRPVNHCGKANIDRRVKANVRAEALLIFQDCRVYTDFEIRMCCYDSRHVSKHIFHIGGLHFAFGSCKRSFKYRNNCVCISANRFLIQKYLHTFRSYYAYFVIDNRYLHEQKPMRNSLREV